MDVAMALNILNGKGNSYRFDIVGSQQPRDSVRTQVESYATENNLQVHFYGQLPMGSLLFDRYVDADVFVNASRASEGFPRTLWEAAAHSLPIVATSVGSIPYYLDDAKQALLVPPRDPRALANALERVVNEPQLRRTMISEARKLARKNTLEVRSKELAKAIEDWMGGG
jgi:glycosyltransferase involved in cell wall biosynthesis